MKDSVSPLSTPNTSISPTSNQQANVPPQSIHESASLRTILFRLLAILIIAITIGFVRENLDVFSLIPSLYTLTGVQNELSSAPAPATIPTKESLDTVADWKTYTDTKYSFQISYPSDWVLNVVEETTIVPFPLITLHPQNRRVDDIALSIGPTNQKNQGVIDNPSSTPSRLGPVISPVIFAKRSARETYKDFGGYYSHEIKIDDLSGLTWNQFNKISYHAVQKDYDSLKMIKKILSTFRFTVKFESVQ